MIGKRWMASGLGLALSAMPASAAIDRMTLHVLGLD